VGKGDLRSRRGKIHRGTRGKTRPKGRNKKREPSKGESNDGVIGKR
jgi:ribosomal small subunit protein bTHX